MTDTICQVSERGVYLGQSRLIEDTEGCPVGWVRAPVPEDYAGHTPVWSADGYWVYTDTPPATLPAPVPTRISMLQATLALIHYGLYDAVDTAIRNSGDNVLLLYWTRSTEGFERRHPSILMVQAWMGWTDEQMDDMFRLAVTLT